MDIARQMIESAANFCGAQAVKFQKRDNKSLLPPEQYNAPHPVPDNSYGSTYGQHREYLEFSVDQHRELKQFCDKVGVIYSTSVWDTKSAHDIISLDPEFIKVPSASNLHFEMLGTLCDHYQGKIQLSLGMTTRNEEEDIVSFFEDKGRSQDLLLYACTSGYPVPSEDIALLEITRLQKQYGSRVEAIGFSGHHLGIALDIAAYTLGASWIERHFTFDRTWKGTDHAASLEPGGLRKLVRDLGATHKALSHKTEEILPIEVETRKKLKWKK
jgi:sialic acid synthase SpsE